MQFKLSNNYSVILVLLATTLAACGGGDGTNLDVNGKPIDDTNPSRPLEPTLASIQENILTPSCGISGCHAPGTAPFGLRLDDEALSAQLLINVASSEVPALLRVKPFDPDNSYIIHKIEGTQAGGERMPLKRTPLSVEQIQIIRDWITDGAPIGNTTTLTAEELNITDLSNIQQSVFNPHCIVCHSGIAPPAGLNLEEGSSYKDLVNISRFPADPDYPVRVIPGDAENSFLIKKLEGRLKQGEGVPMPLSQSPLSQEVINDVRHWIDSGAKPASDQKNLQEVHNDKK